MGSYFHSKHVLNIHDIYVLCNTFVYSCDTVLNEFLCVTSIFFSSVYEVPHAVARTMYSMVYSLLYLMSHFCVILSLMGIYGSEDAYYDCILA